MGRTLTTAALLSLMGAGCDDGRDDSNDRGGGDESAGGLASVLGSFSNAASGQRPLTNDETGNLSTSDCEQVCTKLVECMPGGGCENYLLLPESVRSQGWSDCNAGCGGSTIGRDELDRFLAAECRDVLKLVYADDDIFKAMCQARPASQASCDTFCDLLQTCAEEPVADDDCRVVCIYGDGVECVAENADQSCVAFATCKDRLPAGDDE